MNPAKIINPANFFVLNGIDLIAGNLFIQWYKPFAST